MTRLVKKIMAVLGLIGVELGVMLVVGFVCVAVFFAMYKLVFIDQYNGLDNLAFGFAENIANENRTAFMKFVTFFASKDFLIYGSIGLGLLFYFFKKHRWYSLKIPVVAAGSSLLNQGLKFWFDRPRPETAFYEQSGFSFPSGHAMIGGAFYGLLIYLVWTSVSSRFWKVVLTIILIGWVFLIGFSRVYLHVHYASDVLAGWAAGFAFLIISLTLLKKVEQKYARQANPLIENGP